MDDRDVGSLNLCSCVGWHAQGNVGDLGQPTAPPTQRDSKHADFGRLEGTDDIGTSTARADTDQDVPRSCERPHLSSEDLVECVVVGNARKHCTVRR
jgi:hypothetical protein